MRNKNIINWFNSYSNNNLNINIIFDLLYIVIINEN